MKYALMPALLLNAFVTGVALNHDRENPHGSTSWNCQDCHTTESWQTLRSDLKFDHSQTGFRLDGAHTSATCVGCHRDLVFSHVGTACLDCHLDHHQGQLSPDCSDCHTPRDWQPRHDLLLRHAERGFALTGVHAVADCEACHHDRDRFEFVGTPTDCESCHANDLMRAVDPYHQVLAFQNDCERCHHAAFGSWSRTTYQHPSTFPLTGAHRTIDCAGCHSSGFSGTPSQCFDCHAAEYASAQNPDHQQSGLAATCNDCHSTSAWVPATFDHTVTGFPLVGRHRLASCISCHQTSYAGTPSACFACHQTEYESTTDPSHTAANFPPDCENCHTPSGWQPASWDHDNQYFPIYSGAHNNRWDLCSDCHTVPSDFAVFDCTNCHEHDQADMDAEHREVSGYQYLSSACYECHPRGSH